MRLYKIQPEIAVSYAGVHPYLILFCSGMLAAYLSFKENRIHLPWVAVLLAFISIQILLEFSERGLNVKDINIGFCAMSFLVAIEKSRNRIFNIRWAEKVLSNRYLGFFGTYAYSIYLFHPLILQLLYQLMIKTTIAQATLFYLFLTVGAALILAICYGMFLLFEKPFLNKRSIIADTVTNPAP
jgi:peptidoglycan/LPS O-acetylase OafA/YrhL